MWVLDHEYWTCWMILCLLNIYGPGASDLDGVFADLHQIPQTVSLFLLSTEQWSLSV